MIDKKLNLIRDKSVRGAIKMDELVLTKDESLYLLRLLDLSQTEINKLKPRDNYNTITGGKR